MTSEQFTYWLQGFMELDDTGRRPSPRQWQVIKDHLELVFDKKTPVRPNLELDELLKKYPPNTPLFCTDVEQIC